ncbi:Mu transposase domain-containing protein [Streptomyces sp. NPDC087538]|uniref:Mu transposase domain-containing protein n=1 Tax=Streptomyces sp. NPDC087538 TaxID=3365797 RepID=UPI0037FA67C3
MIERSPSTWWRFQTWLGRDHHVRVDTCDCSADSAAIDHQVAVLAGNDQITVFAFGGEIVAQHAPAAGPAVSPSPTPSTQGARDGLVETSGQLRTSVPPLSRSPRSPTICAGGCSGRRRAQAGSCLGEADAC